MKIVITILIIILISSFQGLTQERRFGISFVGGYSYLAMGDFDKTENYYQLAGIGYKMDDPSTTYSTDSPDDAFDVEVKLFFFISSGIMLSLDTGYIRSRADIVDLKVPEFFAIKQNTTVSTIPLSGTVYYHLLIPQIAHFRLTFGGGVGWYTGKVTYNCLQTMGTDWKLEYDGDFYSSGLGFHTIVGAEYFFTDSYSLCFDFGARYAKLSGFKGDVSLKEIDGGHITTKKFSDDRLVMAKVLGTPWEWLDSKSVIDAYTEDSEFFEYSYWDAKVDFSGISLRLGLKFYI